MQKWVSLKIMFLLLYHKIRGHLRAQIFLGGALLCQQQIPKGVCNSKFNFWCNDVICDVMIFL